MGFLIFIMAIILMTNSKMMTPRAAGQQESRFTIRNDRFYLDDKPFQIISGAIHYFRIHPELWKDRLIRCKALGLNAVEIYVPWNYHEERPGEYRWSGEADIERFIDIAQELDLMVLVRAGPYICAEWEFGGFPAWLSSPAVAGGGKMRLRSSDPVYLAHVERWWRALFSRLRKYLVTSGGPVLMVQIENEYGYCGSDKVYLRHLAKYAKALLGDNVILYTTDPAAVTSAGSLPGDEVLTTVDFGPGWFYPEQYYAAQRSMNAAGRSPPVDSEFYTGWLTHWGEAMANTSADALAADTDTLLRWENNSGNLNFYMVHGGTNFGFWAGANVDYDGTYMPTITSYDYHAPISEAGDYCQPGIGGGCKFHAVRAAIAGYIGTDPPSIPDRPAIKAYGSIEMVPVGPLVHDDSDGNLVKPLLSDVPMPMEDYGQKWGIIVYRTRVSLDQMFGLGGSDDGYLDVGLPVHDYATVLLNGTAVGTLERSGSSGLKINRSRVASMTTEQGEQGAIVMDIVVQGMGRQNFGCDAFAYGAWDRKGLQDQKVLLNGKTFTSGEEGGVVVELVSIYKLLKSPRNPFGFSKRFKSPSNLASFLKFSKSESDRSWLKLS